jgi:prepilin-type N-terminal cleavage/methylation domain-containing protein
MILRNQRGFTLAEVMVATLVTTLVLGGAVMLTTRPASRKVATRSTGSAA